MTHQAVQLAIETTGRAGEICLGRDAQVLALRSLPQARRHNVELIPTLDALLDELQIDRQSLAEIYVSLGPGSFTGLRIGVTTAKILAMTLNAKLVGVATLDALIPNVPATFTHAAVCLNTKRGTTYGGVFERTGETFATSREVVPRGVWPIEALLEQTPADAAVLGEAIDATKVTAADRGLTQLPDEQARVSSRVVWELGRAGAAAGRFVDAMQLTPVYGREPEAVRLWNKRG